MKEREWMRLLRQSHEMARSLTERLEDEDVLAARKFYKDQLTNVLGGHLRAIEVSMLPAIQRHGWKGVRSSVLTAHFDLKAATARLVVSDPASEQFDEVVDQLRRQLDRERHVEQTELVPAVQAALPAEECRQLSIDVDLCLQRSVGELDTSAVAAPLSNANPIEEARLILSSIPEPGLDHQPSDSAAAA